MSKKAYSVLIVILNMILGILCLPLIITAPAVIVAVYFKHTGKIIKRNRLWLLTKVVIMASWSVQVRILKEMTKFDGFRDLYHKSYQYSYESATKMVAENLVV